MSAHIERFTFEVDIEGVAVDERAVLSCGCSVFRGVTQGEVVTIGRPCMIPHQRLVDRAQELLVADALQGDGSPTIERVLEALDQAEAEIRPQARTHGRETED